MKRIDTDKLEDRGLLVDLENGERGVPVSLQCRTRLTGLSRQQRRDRLLRFFDRVSRDWLSGNGTIDLGSLSILGQTVQGVLAARNIDQTVARLESEGVRVDIVEDLQVLD